MGTTNNDVLLINSSTLTNIADAIRLKKNVNTKYYPYEMATAIESITISNSYQVNITQTANQTISVQEVLNPNKTGNESSFSIDTASYDPPYIKVTLTAATGYNKGTLNVSENTNIRLTNTVTNISATAATIKTYNLILSATTNQTITLNYTEPGSSQVTVTSTSSQRTFTVKHGTTWTATISASSGYNPGTLSASSGTVTSATTISATAATMKRQIVINQVTGSTISVQYKGTTYTNSFYLNSPAVGDYVYITQTADSGYKLGDLTFNGTTQYSTNYYYTTFNITGQITSVSSSSFTITFTYSGSNKVITSSNNIITISQEENMDLSNMNMTITVLDDFTTHQSLNVYVDDTLLSYGDNTINLAENHSLSVSYTVDQGYLAGDIIFGLVKSDQTTEFLPFAQSLGNPFSYYLWDYDSIISVEGYVDEGIREIIIGFNKEAVAATLVTTLNNVNIGFTFNLENFISIILGNLYFNYNGNAYSLNTILCNNDTTNQVKDNLDDMILDAYSNNLTIDKIGINGTEYDINDYNINLVPDYTYALKMNNIPLYTSDLTSAIPNNSIYSEARYIITKFENNINDNEVFYIRFPQFGSTLKVNSYHTGLGIYTDFEGHMIPIDIWFMYIFITLSGGGAGTTYIEDENDNPVNFTAEIWRV